MRATNPKLVRKWSRAVRSLNTSDDIKLRAATKKAIRGDGTVDPLAVPATGALVIIPLFRESNLTNGSTSVWVEHLSETIGLGGGVWNITLITMTRAGNTGDSNVNVKQTLNGVDGDNIITQIGTNTGSLGFFLPNTFLGVSGDEPIEVKTWFKSATTGTSNMRDDVTILIGMRQ